MEKNLIIYLASDHAGFFLKEKIKKHLLKKNFVVHDFGPPSYKKEDDYTDYIIPCARKIASTKNSLGVILGGTGQGEAIAANKVSGIRAVVLYSLNPKIIKLSKKHNNANMLALGARFLTEKETLAAIDIFLKTKFSGEARHKRRLKKIADFEKM